METIIEVICMFCKEHVGFKDGQGISGVSHGCCKKCYDIQTKEIELEKV